MHADGEQVAQITISGNVALAERLIGERIAEVARNSKGPGVQWDTRIVDIPQDVGPDRGNMCANITAQM